MWVPLASFTCIALGTLSGGWKIVKTMGTRITKVTPLEGVSAETAGAITLFISEKLGIPGQYYPYDRRVDHGCGRRKKTFSGSLGCYDQPPLGLDPDHSRQCPVFSDCLRGPDPFQTLGKYGSMGVWE